MNPTAPLSASPLRHDLLTSLLLLTASVAGGWLACQSLLLSSSHTVHLRLLMILLVQPFALAAWLFCGLPGLGLAVKSLRSAFEQHRVGAGIFSAVLLALGLVSASFWF